MMSVIAGSAGRGRIETEAVATTTPSMHTCSDNSMDRIGKSLYSSITYGIVCGKSDIQYILYKYIIYDKIKSGFISNSSPVLPLRYTH